MTVLTFADFVGSVLKRPENKERDGRASRMFVNSFYVAVRFIDTCKVLEIVFFTSKKTSTRPDERQKRCLKSTLNAASSFPAQPAIWPQNSSICLTSNKINAKNSLWHRIHYHHELPFSHTIITYLKKDLQTSVAIVFS